MMLGFCRGLFGRRIVLCCCLRTKRFSLAAVFCFVMTQMTSRRCPELFAEWDRFRKRVLGCQASSVAKGSICLFLDAVHLYAAVTTILNLEMQHCDFCTACEVWGLRNTNKRDMALGQTFHSDSSECFHNEAELFCSLSQVLLGRLLITAEYPPHSLTLAYI